jgi:hypothetical protein
MTRSGFSTFFGGSLAGVILASGACGQIIIEDSMKGASPPAGWSVVKGAAMMTGDALQLQNTGGSPWSRDSVVVARDGDASIGNYDCRVRVEPVAMPAWGWNRASLLFRVNQTAWATYGLGPSFSGYVVNFIGEGDTGLLAPWFTPTMSMGRVVGSSYAELGRSFDPIPAGAFDVRVRAVDDRVQLFVNSAMVFDVSDPDGPRSGGVGCFNIWETTGRYSNVLVTAPSLFEDHFDGPPDAAWRVIKGVASVDAGRLRLQDPEFQLPRDSIAVVHDGDETWTDYEYRARVEPFASGYDHWVRSTLIARTSDAAWAWYGMGANFSGYALSYVGPGDPGLPGARDLPRVYLSRTLNGQSVQLAELEWPHAIGPVEFAMRFQGDEIEVLGDGESLWSGRDPGGPTHGGVGVFNVWESGSYYDDVMVIPLPRPCRADFNRDGGVDGSDVSAFFEAWERGDAEADVNFDGGVDGTDAYDFFRQWEAGGC